MTRERGDGQAALPPQHGAGRTGLQYAESASRMPRSIAASLASSSTPGGLRTDVRGSLRAIVRVAPRGPSLRRWTSRARHTFCHARPAVYRATKRVVDIVASALGLALLAPIFTVVAVAIRVADRGPVFYRQTRVGRGGRTFCMLKFRSMRVDADAQRQAVRASSDQLDAARFKLKRDPRITSVGHFLRRTSIDELPQLWNVLRGDMSLVGPRPPLESEVALYAIRSWSRLDVRPGITCTWQISGRSDIPFEQQVELDIDYIQNRTFLRDLSILLGTVPAVISGRGAY